MIKADWLNPVIDFRKLCAGIRGYFRYFFEWRAYSQMPNAEILKFGDAFPCLHDRTSATEFGGHYFYQNIWAFKAIYRTRPPVHVDVGSLAAYVGMLTAITRVVFIDIRPLLVQLENLESRDGSILEMPFKDNSVESISCLHVAEHVGLGRYGDDLDPDGTRKAALELIRVLAPEGNLYFSVPLGKPRICFNAHRIHSPQQILEYFNSLRLVEFSAIDDSGIFREAINPSELENATYACGLFHFGGFQ